MLYMTGKSLFPEWEQKKLKFFLNFFLKNFENFAQCRKKTERGDPLVSSGFVGYVKKVKNERGDPFALISADRTWPLMLVVLVVSIVRKVAQSERL